MKRFAFRILSVLLAFALLFALASCAGNISDENAKADVTDFFNALEVQNHARAKTLLHPGSDIDVAAFAEALEASHGLRYTDGVTVEDVTVTKNTVYTGAERSTHKILSVTLLVNETRISANVHLLKDGAGYGIYRITVLGSNA